MVVSLKEILLRKVSKALHYSIMLEVRVRNWRHANSKSLRSIARVRAKGAQGKKPTVSWVAAGDQLNVWIFLM